MPDRLKISSKSLKNKTNCHIESTIACYEALQFSYFDDYKMQDWIKNGVGVIGTPYHWEEESGCQPICNKTI